jgi:type I restriction enzyme S subunit
MAVSSILTFEKINKEERWDAESYTPRLLELDIQFSGSPILRELATVTHASEIPRLYTYEEDRVRFLLAQNIRPILPDYSAEFFIPGVVAAQIPVNRLQTDDVLVTRSGANSGVSCVYLGETGACYTSGEGLIVRSKGDINGAYLVLFLNTGAGLELCRRCIYGSGQPHVGPRYLERIHVPRLGKIEDEIARLVGEANRLNEQAAKLYPDAESELLDRIGWHEVEKIPRELAFVTNLSELKSAERFDAEHYELRYTRLRNRLSSLGALVLKECCGEPVRGVQPQYVDSGEILVINSKLLGPTHLDIGNALRTSREFFDRPDVRMARVEPDDALVYSTGAYIGRTNSYLEEEPAIASNHVTILRSNPAICDPIYLAIFLNSPAGLLQSQQFATGSAQRELYPHHIRQFLIFLPRNNNGEIELAWQVELADKVRTAARAKKEVREKLQKAKDLVEQAINQAPAALMSACEC